MSGGSTLDMQAQEDEKAFGLTVTRVEGSAHTSQGHYISKIGRRPPQLIESYLSHGQMKKQVSTGSGTDVLDINSPSVVLSKTAIGRVSLEV
jgi:hypothetical protein